MKKYLLAGALGLVTTIAVTATVLTHNSKKTTTNTSKTVTHKHHCTRGAFACY